MSVQAFMFEPEYTEEELEERFQGEEEVMHGNGLTPSTEVSRVGRRDWCKVLSHSSASWYPSYAPSSDGYCFLIVVTTHAGIGIQLYLPSFP